MPEIKQTIAKPQRENERLRALLSAAAKRQNAAYCVYGHERDIHRPGSPFWTTSSETRAGCAPSRCAPPSSSTTSCTGTPPGQRNTGTRRSSGMMISGCRTRATAPSCTFGTPCCCRSCTRRGEPP